MMRSRFGMWARCLANLVLCSCLLGMASPQEGPAAEAIDLGRQGVDLLDEGLKSGSAEKLIAARVRFRAAMVIWLAIDNLQGQAAIAGKLAETEHALHNAVEAVDIHLFAADLWKRQRTYHLSLRNYEMATRIAVESGNVAPMCDILGGRGEVRLAMGEYGSALQDLRDAAEWCGQRADPKGKARVLSALGDLYTKRGRYDDAMTALAGAAGAGAQDDAIRMSISKNLGVLHTRAGRFEDAQVELEQARSLAIQTKNKEFEGVILTALGRTYSELGRYAEARTRYEQALELLVSSEIPLQTDLVRGGLRPLFASTVNELGSLHLAQGNSVEGTSSPMRLEAALDPDSAVVLRGGSDRRMVALEGSLRHNLAAALLVLGDNEAALKQLQSVLTVAYDLSDPALEGRVLSQSGLALRALHQDDDAAENFRRALELQVRIGDVVGEITTLGHAATLDRERGRFPDAMAKLRRANVSFSSMPGIASCSNAVSAASRATKAA